MERLLTPEEVAERLRIAVADVRMLVTTGELAAYDVGGEYRFLAEDLASYLARRRITGHDHTLVEASRFSRFTDQLRKVLTQAYDEAQRFDHTCVATEHLLLALVSIRPNIALQVLSALSVDYAQVRSNLEFLIAQSSRKGAVAELDAIPRRLAPQTERVLELTFDEAARLGHGYVGPEHLLLGLLRVEEGMAADVLAMAGVSLEQARLQTIQTLALRQAAIAQARMQLIP